MPSSHVFSRREFRSKRAVIRASLLLVGAQVCLMLIPAHAAGAVTTRSATWAEPVKLAGVPNLYKVNDKLYRSAQPTAEGMTNLKRMGIKTVVNLRAFHEDADEASTTGLECLRIPVNTWDVDEKDIVRFLKIVTDPARAPVLVHCQHGADRTGTMCAIYRMAVDGWSRDEAIREMTEGGFGYHAVWKNLIKFLRKVNVSKVRRAAGIE